MKNTHFDTALKCLLAGCLITLLLLPYAVGRVQFNGAVSVMQNLGNECNSGFDTDGEIENVLSVFNFDLAWHESPTFADYWIAGYKTKF